MERPGAISDQHVPRTVRLDGLTLSSGLSLRSLRRDCCPVAAFLVAMFDGGRMSDLHDDFGDVDAAAGARDVDRGDA